MDNKSGLNILVCGSKQFEDKKFVFGILDQLFYHAKGRIANVYTSNFSGTCSFAKEWVSFKNEEISLIAKETNHKNPPFIKIKDCTFDMILQERNASLYEQLNIPEAIVQNDPFFQKGKELMMENNINSILAFPNPSGKLGAATHNIQRFAQLAGIGDYFMDCSKAVEQIAEKKKAVSIQNNSGFVNQHSTKKP